MDMLKFICDSQLVDNRDNSSLGEPIVSFVKEVWAQPEGDKVMNEINPEVTHQEYSPK